MKNWLLLIVMVATVFGQSQPALRFQAVDLFIDSGEEALAAYQLEFAAMAGNVKVVGVEGGDAEVFKQPPYYDPKAMQRERVIVAAFSGEPAAKLPRGKTRVATIHVQIAGEARPEFTLKVQAAGNSAGQRMQVDANYEFQKEP